MANKISVLIDVTIDKAVSSFKDFGTAVRDADGLVNKFKAGSKAGFAAVKANAGALALGAGAALLKFGDDIIRAGSEMEAMDAKAETVFGASLGKVKAWGEQNAASLGLTTRESTTAAAAIADLLKPMGFTEAAAAGMSLELMDLAGALSAWTGGQMSAADVSQTFTKAMLGEREQLKTLGISILESEVQARLAEKGQKNLTGATLAQAKALAVQELILEKSTDAQKAWADGSMDGVKGTNEAKASLATLSEVMNESLYPVLVNLVPVVADLAEAMTPLAKAVALVTTGQIGFASANEKAAYAAEDLESRVESLGWDYDKLWFKVRTGQKSIEELTAEVEEAEASNDRLSAAVVAAATTQDEFSEAVILGTGHLADLTAGGKAYNDAIEAAERATKDFDAAVSEMLGEVNAEQAWLDIKAKVDGFAADMAAAKGDTDAERLATLALKESMIEYVGTLETVPTEKKTEILALIDEENFRLVEAELAKLEKSRYPVYTPVFNGGGASAGGGAQYFHEGGVVQGPKGSEQLAVLKAGETVLPTHLPSSGGGMGSAGGSTTNIYNITTAADERRVVDVIKRYERRGGRL